MSDIVYIRQKYKEISGNANADDVPIYAMRQVVKAYKKGRADAIDECLELVARLLAHYEQVDFEQVEDDLHLLMNDLEQLKEQK